jgi:P4 family phage/plasmid primase-like protien
MPYISISIGDTSRKYEAADLNTEWAASLVDDLADEPDGSVNIRVKGLADLSTEGQRALWMFYRAVMKQRTVTLRRIKKYYTHPIDLVLAQLVGGEDPEKCEQRLRAATTAVAQCYSPEAQLLCLEKLHKKLKALGVVGIRVKKLKEMIEGASQVGGTHPQSGRPNPTLLAADFLKRYRAKLGCDGLPDDAHILQYHGSTWYYWDQVWREVVPDEMRSLVTKDLQDSSGVPFVTTSLVGNVLENLRGLALVGQGKEPLPFYISDYTPPTMISRRHMLVLQNGLLDLDALANGETVELLDFDPCWFGTSILPFGYDPDAKCSKFRQFLYQILERNPKNGKALHPGDKRLRVLQEWFGYTLLCDGRYQKFLLMLGEGNNGKGVLQNLWLKMLGVDNVSHVSLDQLSGEFALQPLLGRMANICGDLCEIDQVAEGILKRLTGQDNITVNRKNQTMISMAPSVKLIFATNALPRFSDKSLGIWRRLMAMPFRGVVADDKVNETLAEELEEELPGILNWALAGLRRLLDQGHFSHCVICNQAAQKHRFDCDPVAQFLDERVKFAPQGSTQLYEVLKDTFYQEYSQCCEQGGFKALSKNRFNRQLSKVPGITERRVPHADSNGNRPYFWVGIGKPIPMPALDEDDSDE